MPITPFPSSNTKRYFIGVQNAGQQHHIQVRCADTVSDSDAITNLGFVVGILLPVTFNDYIYNELLVAIKGEDIRNPVAGWTPQTGTQAVAQVDVQQPLTLGARGRSATGHKVKLFLWGQAFVHDADWLYTPGAGTDHASFANVLNASPTYFLAIDGTKPVWKSDFTVNYNDHWVKVVRP